MNPLLVGHWAQFYYENGWNPLPSRGDRKGPALESYAHYRDGVRIPSAWCTHWPAPNIQLALGVPWRLLVVDVDGPRALEQWCRWHVLGREWPETWAVRTKGGRHFYYRIPDGVTTCPTRKIWVETRNHKVVKHSEIQILADKALAIAPPSRHVDPPHPTYAFLHGRQPEDLPVATAPTWLLNCKEWRPPQPKARRVKLAHRFNARTGQSNYESIESIPPLEKLALVKQWGLRVVGEHANHKGWITCHAIDRDDQHPSASLHLESGVFWQAGQRAMSFPSLAVALGVVICLRDAFEMLGIKSTEGASR